MGERERDGVRKQNDSECERECMKEKMREIHCVQERQTERFASTTEQESQREIGSERV